MELWNYVSLFCEFIWFVHRPTLSNIVQHYNMAARWMRFRKLSQEASEKLKVHSSLQQLSEATPATAATAGSLVKTCEDMPQNRALLRSGCG